MHRQRQVDLKSANATGSSSGGSSSNGVVLYSSSVIGCGTDAILYHTEAAVPEAGVDVRV